MFLASVLKLKLVLPVLCVASFTVAGTVWQSLHTTAVPALLYPLRLLRCASCAPTFESLDTLFTIVPVVPAVLTPMLFQPGAAVFGWVPYCAGVVPATP
jgi:hypothetical protein